MATMNVSLPDAMRDWVQSRIDSGQFANNSDYIRDLIRRDQQRAEKLRALEAAIEAGRASGIAEAFEMEKLQRELDGE